MAQAFSSFDTYLAPFVKVDGLTQKETKQCIQSFVYGVNTPSRWGCVKETTKVLTRDGWKGPSDLTIGDLIFTYVDGEIREAPLKHIIHKKNECKIMHQYRGENYVQTVSPEHRCLIEYGKDFYILKKSEEIFNSSEEIYMPLCVINDEMTVSIPTAVKVTKKIEIPYEGDVWCPSTEDGTAIYQDEEGNIFVSGNCQAPFSNITLDWTVPNDLKNLPAIVGGKEMDFTYGDCKKEMDMINKAFIEIMIEGDHNGRGFQYPMNCVA